MLLLSGFHWRIQHFWPGRKTKPAPQMFRAALARADVREHQMIHVGDNPIDDIRGAADLGIPTIWVNFEARNPESPPATRVVNRLKDIPNAIDEIERSR